MFIGILFNVILSLTQSDGTARIGILVQPQDNQQHSFAGMQCMLHFEGLSNHLINLRSIESEEYAWLNTEVRQDGDTFAVGFFGWGGPFGGSPPVAPMNVATLVFDTTTPINCVPFDVFGPYCISTKVTISGNDDTGDLISSCCSGELTGNGIVDINDLTLLLSHFGCNDSIGLDDLTLVLSNFGQSCH